jgi:hypothetical protein
MRPTACYRDSFTFTIDNIIQETYGNMEENLTFYEE